MDKSAVVRAHPNIAFIKYWGNQNDHLRIPSNSSLSMNLDGLYTETYVEWSARATYDSLTLNGVVQVGQPLERVARHLDEIRRRLNINGFAHVESMNNFPMGAGIASSASSFAALTLAATTAAGINLPEIELTRLARLGSGSASRSIPAGFVEWHAGGTHEESYAESFAPANHWDLVDIVTIVSEGHKTVGSTEGHHSATSSELQGVRVAGAAKRVAKCKQAILERDFMAFAEVVEYDSNLMHAIMMTSHPPLFYWQPASIAVMEAVRKGRRDGLDVCYTLDAGPNVHCICVRKDSDAVCDLLRVVPGVWDVRLAGAGGGAVVLRDGSVNR